MQIRKTKNKIELLTQINKNNSNTNSLKSTIPYEIVKFFNLNAHDTVKWILDLDTDDLKIEFYE